MEDDSVAWREIPLSESTLPTRRMAADAVSYGETIFSLTFLLFPSLLANPEFLASTPPPPPPYPASCSGHTDSCHFQLFLPSELINMPRSGKEWAGSEKEMASLASAYSAKMVSIYNRGRPTRTALAAGSSEIQRHLQPCHAINTAAKNPSSWSTGLSTVETCTCR